MKGKSKLVIVLLAIFFGWFGADKMYFGGLKKPALIMCLFRFLTAFTGILLLVWIIIDIYQVLAKDLYKLNPLDYRK